MTKLDYELEKHYRGAASRPQRKFEETITSFDRTVYFYDRDEVARQADSVSRTPSTERVTYELHRKAIETAATIMHKNTQHGIAMAILTHRFFTAYRNTVFAGRGTFVTDYSFLVTKVGTLFNASKGAVIPSRIATKLTAITVKTLVQINHLHGTIVQMSLPKAKTSEEWARALNASAPASTVYKVINA